MKVKIETHKRENRRLAGLIDQQKDDNARLSVRLTGTEKQRDDALEALVLQQEIAEELERERKRNKKELAALQHTNVTIVRQRDEARRVVLHLRSLIGGQSHHMEHLVQSLTTRDDLAGEIEEGFDEEEAENLDDGRSTSARSRAVDGSTNTGMADRMLKNPSRGSKRHSAASFNDVADRHLKDKTDAISHIIRNIAEQCQAAVEGLQLAQDAEIESSRSPRRASNLSTASSVDGHDHSAATSEAGDDSLLHPSGRASSIPPTPDLIPNRSSTSMSMASTMTTPERASQQYSMHNEIPTKIVEDDEDDLAERSENEAVSQEPGIVGKHAESLIHRPSGARISALGGTR